MRKRVVYPGTFDPITNGHLDIIERAKRLFDEVIVAVAFSNAKRPMFDIEDRVRFVQSAIEPIDGVRAISFNSLLVDLLKQEESFVIVRGLRAVSDFEHELQMDYANSSLYSEMETIYLSANINNSFVSSSVVRSVLSFNGDISHLVPDSVYKMIEELKCT